MKIAVCVTIRNRQKETRKTIASIKKYMPKDGRLFIVDDQSEPKFMESDYRFEVNAGVPRAKNKCIELAMDWGAEHIFLLDSDVEIIKDEWWLPYIESEEPHLQAEFLQFAKGRQTLKDNRIIYNNGKIVAYACARGYFLYFKRICFGVVGGFNVQYGKGMYEHSDLSNRIFNAGLTSFRFQDIVGSDKYIRSMDQYRETASSIDFRDRANNLRNNRGIFARSWTEANYCEYRDKKTTEVRGENVIITSYLTLTEDHQRGEKWTPNMDDLSVFLNSVKKHKARAIVLNDCFDEDETFVRADSVINPYFQRWINTYQYLRKHKEIGFVWVVDGTDTELLKEPFGLPAKLYVGDERGTINNRWLMQHTRSQTILSWIRNNLRLPILNPGVMGGSREDIMMLLHNIMAFYFDNGMSEISDMPLFNYICRTKHENKLHFGRDITTVFKDYEKNNKTAIWKHK